MFSSISMLLIQIIESFSNMIFTVFAFILPDQMTYLESIGFNIYLFSDSGWFTEPLPIIMLFQFGIIIFLLIFLIRLLYKGTKKFINMVFGVFRV
jgi:hypothetical protein